MAVDNGKQRKESKGSKKASRGSTPATDAATTSGGEEAEDRWDFECIECGQSGDPLLCCEVCAALGTLLRTNSAHWDLHTGPETCQNKAGIIA